MAAVTSPIDLLTVVLKLSCLEQDDEVTIFGQEGGANPIGSC